MTKRQIIILSVLSTIIVGIVGYLYTNQSSSFTQKQSTVVPTKFLKTQVVSKDSLPLTIETYGRVLSARNVTLSSEVQGVISEGTVPLKSGARFKKGDVLFKIDNRQANYSLRSLKASFLNLVASILPDLNIDYTDSYPRWKDFFEAIDVNKPLPDLPEVKSIKEKTFLATKNVLSEYYTIKSQEELLKKYTVHAPFSGSIVQAFTEEGTTVNAGVNIASIIKNDALEVQVPIDVQNVHLVTIGSQVALQSQDEQNAWEGTVSRIGQSVNSTTQSIDLFVTVNSKSQKAQLFNGMFLNATIHAGYIANSVELPRRALQTENSVYLIKDSTLVSTKVSIDKSNPETFVTRSLQTNDRVVIEPVTSTSLNLKVAPLK